MMTEQEQGGSGQKEDEDEPSDTWDAELGLPHKLEVAPEREEEKRDNARELELREELEATRAALRASQEAYRALEARHA